MGVHGGKVDLGYELNGGRLVGVVFVAVHLDAVDAVLVDRLAFAPYIVSIKYSIFASKA